MSSNGTNTTTQGLQKNSLLSMTEEKMTKFIYGGYRETRHEKEKQEKLAKQKKEEEETAVAYSEYVKTFEQSTSSTTGAPLFVRGGTINNKGIAESAKSDSYQLYTIGNPKSDSVLQQGNSTASPSVPAPPPPPPPASQSKQQPFKMTFTKFVPAPKKNQQSPSKQVQTDVKLLFGGGDDESDEEKKKETSIIVNRKTNIHYAVHNNGQKSQLDLLYEKMTRESKNHQTQVGRGHHESNTQELNQTVVDEDPTNTNLFLWNLPHKITDETLYRLCAFYGHVRSVNIKYPKNSPEYTKQNVLAFVVMDTHEEARLVINNLSGHSLDEFTIRVGWGKGSTRNCLLYVPQYAKVNCINSPSSSETRHLIQSIAIHVHNRGTAFETQLMKRIDDSNKWNFLLDSECNDHLYYKWCVLVLGNNESFSDYSLLPFQFVENGEWYLPPPVYNDDNVNRTLDAKIANLNKAKGESIKTFAEEEQKREERMKQRLSLQGSNIFLDSIQNRLSSTQYEWLIGSLQSITPRRSNILRIMTFCMDNSLYADHIIEILRDSICDTVPHMKLFYEEIEGSEKKEPIPCKPTVRLARLYVINDLLYNADNGCSTSYRTLIQSELPLMFEAVARMHNSIEDPILKKEIRIRIEKMLNGWIENSLLSINFLKGLQVTFMMTNEELDKEIDDSSCEDSTDSLRLQCKYNGLCNYGTKGQLLMRLQKLKEYTDLKASELVIEVDPELDGEPLSDSDYDGCY